MDESVKSKHKFTPFNKVMLSRIIWNGELIVHKLP